MHSLRTEIDRTVDAKEELSLLRKYGTKVVKGSLRGFVEGRLDEVARRTERELTTYKKDIKLVLENNKPLTTMFFG